MLEEEASVFEHDANVTQATTATAMTLRMLLMFNFIDIKFIVVSKVNVRLPLSIF